VDSYERTEVVQPTGIVGDISPFEMPAQVWSSGDNINFRRGRTNANKASSNPFSSLVLGASPTLIHYFEDSEAPYWLVCGKTTGPADSKVFKVNSAGATEVGAGFNDSRSIPWSVTPFNELHVLNNRSDHPQMLKAPYTAVEDLANWASTSPWGASSRCEVIRSYKNYLLALDCYDEDSNRYPNMVRWSSPAQLGDPPVSWDASVVGEQAGLYALADSPGRVIDGLSLGDYFVVYKTDAVWLMQFIGGEFTMKFRKLFAEDTGILAKNCVVEFQGKHFVLGSSDCYIHNGSTKEHVMDGWVKDEFFNNVHTDYIQETKVVADYNNSEVIIYYISKANVEAVPYADRALVWNWTTQSWSRKALNQASWIASGFIVPETPADTTWDDDDESWDRDNTLWDENTTLNANLEGLLVSHYVDQSFSALENENGSDIFSPTSYVQRIGVDFDNDRRFKMVERIVPHIDGSLPVTITVYCSDRQTITPTPSAVVVFDPNIDVDVDVHVVGRYIGVRFECAGAFTLNGYTIEWKPVGSL
jgi:hypothetical protein